MPRPKRYRVQKRTQTLWWVNGTGFPSELSAHYHLTAQLIAIALYRRKALSESKWGEKVVEIENILQNSKVNPKSITFLENPFHGVKLPKETRR